MTAIDHAPDLQLDPPESIGLVDAEPSSSGAVEPAWQSRASVGSSSLAQFFPRSRAEAQLRRRFTAATLGALAIFSLFATPALGVPALLVALLFASLLGVFCSAWWQRNQAPSLAPTVAAFPLPSQMTVQPRTTGEPLHRRRAS